MNELRLAFRRLIKRPGSTTACSAALAAAIASAAVTWSALSSVLIWPLPISDPERLVVVGERAMRGREQVIRTGFVYPRFAQIRESSVFEQAVAQWSSPHTLLVKIGDRSERADVGFATHDFFEVLGVRVVLGREFVPQDDRRGAVPVAVLSQRYWQSAFNASQSVLGQQILVAGKAVTIVGVLERGFRGLELSESLAMYLPFHTVANLGGDETNYFAEAGVKTPPAADTMILGRLRPGMSVAEATARIAALDATSPGGTRPSPIVLIDVNTAAVPVAARTGMEGFARLLAGTVALLLLIGCTTVGMLLLIRTEARANEFAMCMALGASRGSLARGVVWEGALLSAAGAALSLPIAVWFFRLIQVFELPGRVSLDSLDLSLDTRTLAACIGAAAASVVLIGVVAAAFGFRANLADVLRSRTGATVRTTKRFTRATLVGGQVAVAVVLAAGAVLFVRSLAVALSLNPGTDMSRLVMGTLQLRHYGYTPERATDFFDRLRSRLTGNAALEAVAFSTFERGISPAGKLYIDGVAKQFPSTVWSFRVDRDYFEAMGIRLIAGRNLSADDRNNAPAVAVVSESYARHIAQGKTALGREIAWPSAVNRPIRIVGVVSDLVGDVGVLEPLMIYMPQAQGPPALHRDIIARAAPAAGLAAARREILAAVKELDVEIAPTSLRTFEERVLEQMAPQQFGATVLGALGAIAVLLALLGAYVAADSMATARMREMGIRAALGARPRQLGAIVLAETTRLAGGGIAAGLVAVLLGANTIRSFLYHVEPLDAYTLGAVSALILALAVAVTLRAALRTARVDLTSVLKAD